MGLNVSMLPGSQTYCLRCIFQPMESTVSDTASSMKRKLNYILNEHEENVKKLREVQVERREYLTSLRSISEIIWNSNFCIESQSEGQNESVEMYVAPFWFLKISFSHLEKSHSCQIRKFYIRNITSMLNEGLFSATLNEPADGYENITSPSQIFYILYWEKLFMKSVLRVSAETELEKFKIR